MFDKLKKINKNGGREIDYDTIFADNIEKKFFYIDYPRKKLMDGKISLNKTIQRMSKDEYYVLVTYSKDELLPEQYNPLNGYEGNDDTLLATINPNINFNYICQNGEIQLFSRLLDKGSNNPNYLLGPGPNNVSLEELAKRQYNKIHTLAENSKTR